LYLNQQGMEVVGFDIFKPLVSFWSALKNSREELYREVIKYYPLSKDMFYSLQKSCMVEADKIKQGAMFFVLNRCSFSGSTMNGGMSPNHPRFTESILSKLKRFDLSIPVHEQDFMHSLCYSGFAYCDPPYIIKNYLYGNKGKAHKGFNHIKLAEKLNKRNGFVLSYNNIAEIVELYKNHYYYIPKWSYGMGKDKKSKEVLVISNSVYSSLDITQRRLCGSLRSPKCLRHFA